MHPIEKSCPVCGEAIILKCATSEQGITIALAHEECLLLDAKAL